MTTPDSHELVFTRLIDAPRAAVYRCWTEPELLKQWFTPRPWTTPVVETDVRAGGSSYFLFRGPEGEEFPNRGVYLEAVANEKIVFTDAFSEAWMPSDKAFMVGIVTFGDEAGRTRYTAKIRHWSAEDLKSHEARGFHDGWSKAADQLEALARTL
jgi:uncharacterized protein YndB with AHSA1/START domain